MQEVYHTHNLSIDNYSIIEYYYTEISEMLLKKYSKYNKKARRKKSNLLSHFFDRRIVGELQHIIHAGVI